MVISDLIRSTLQLRKDARVPGRGPSKLAVEGRRAEGRRASDEGRHAEGRRAAEGRGVEGSR